MTAECLDSESWIGRLACAAAVAVVTPAACGKMFRPSGLDDLICDPRACLPIQILRTYSGNGVELKSNPVKYSSSLSLSVPVRKQKQKQPTGVCVCLGVKGGGGSNVSPVLQQGILPSFPGSIRLFF